MKPLRIRKPILPLWCYSLAVGILSIFGSYQTRKRIWYGRAYRSSDYVIWTNHKYHKAQERAIKKGRKFK